MMRVRLLALVAALGACVPMTAGAEDAIREGAYLVTYSLELPHLEPMAGGEVRICVASPEANGLPVLSANNPLARCPVSDLARDGAALTFQIACPGPNAAKAQARFELKPEGFEGRIAMNMGGKNMTMTEIQRARRVGPCPPEPTGR